MNLLFLHPNMPGQFKHLARAFGAEGGHRIYFITKHKSASIPGVERITYSLKRPDKPLNPHRYLTTSTAAVLQGQQVWRVCHALKTKEGFEPDVIVGHPGWGDMLFLRELFPAAKILSYFEYYYRAQGADVGFGEKVTEDDFARIRIKNATNLLSLEQADWGITPTLWQWSLHPPEFRQKISVLHDGVDTSLCAPDAGAVFSLPRRGRVRVGAELAETSKTVSDSSASTAPLPTSPLRGEELLFKPGDAVVTYVARNFEPYRGFPTFMKAAEILLKTRPDLHIVAVGADSVSYGRKAPGGKTYRELLLQEFSGPKERLHFVGTLPYAQLIRLFQVSAVHLYLTYPFVLSWSMLEAMACGVALVASDTKPVREVVQHGKNGLLADFFSPGDVAQKILHALDEPSRNAAMRLAARKTVMDRFDLKTTLPLQMQLVRELSRGEIPTRSTRDIARLNPPDAHPQAVWEDSPHSAR